MPWTVTDPMLERTRLVALHREGLYSVAELARRFGVSRKTANKWIARYRDGGAEALADRSHARHQQAEQTPPEVEALIVEARAAHPSWGPRKLLPYLAGRHPDVRLPARSTAGTILPTESGAVGRAKQTQRWSSARTSRVGSACKRGLYRRFTGITITAFLLAESGRQSSRTLAEKRCPLLP